MNFLYAFWVLLPTMVTFFWSITLFFSLNKDNTSKKGLGVFMFAAFVLYACHSIVFFNEYRLYFSVKSLYHLMGLSVYPLFFNYIELMTCKNKVKPLFFIHLIPAISICILFIIFSSTMSEQEISAYLHYLVINNPINTLNANYPKNLYYIFKISRIIFALQAVIYPLVCLYFINKYNHRIKNFYSNTDTIKLNWLKVLVYVMLATGFMSFVFNLIGRIYFVTNNMVIIPSIVFSALLYIIGLQGNNQKSYVAVIEKDFNSSKEIDVFEEISSTQNNALKNNLVKLLEEKQVYLNPNLKITDLCKELGTNRSYISSLINGEFDSNFKEYINNYRVLHAKKMLIDSKNSSFTLAYISENSGFGSVSTFNRCFKKTVGITPNSFREKQLRKT